MRSLRLPVSICTVLMLLVVVPAMAEVFTVHLKNGNSFDTRYKPRVADWDKGKVVILTDVANRITLLRDDIVDITSDTELKGFGTVIDTTTIILGWAPNDAPAPGDQQVDPGAQWLEYLQQAGARPNYSVEQFVNVEDAGRTVGGAQGGLPAWDFGPGATGGGGTQNIVVPPPPMPAAQAPEGNAGDEQ